MPRGRPRKVVSEMTEKNPLDSMIESVDDDIIDVDPNAEKIPSMSSPEWDVYILSKLTNDEKDEENGYPKTEGLGRLVRIVGRVVESSSKIIDASPEYAAVEHTVVLDKGNGPEQYVGVADAHPGNSDGEYNKFLLAVASTRARGRAYRDILGIKTVAAEEVSEKAAEGITATENQKSAIKLLCKKLKIDMMKFINLSGGNYSELGDVPKTLAQRMLSKLNEYQRGDDEPSEDVLL